MKAIKLAIFITFAILVGTIHSLSADSYTKKWSKRSHLNIGSFNTIKIFYIKSDLYINFNNNNLKKFHFEIPNSPHYLSSQAFNSTIIHDTYLIENLTNYLISHCFSLLKNNGFKLHRYESKSSEVQIANANCYTHVASLDMTNNLLRCFPVKITNNWFDKLKSLNLSNNLITNLSSLNDFSTALFRSSLEQIDLSFNKIKFLDEELFKHLSSLKVLNLSNNQIKSVNLFTFSTNAHNLFQLDLSHNSLSDLEFLLFSSLVNLKELNLNSNYIQSLPTHLLYNLYALEKLHVSGNNLKTFNLFSLSSKNNEYLRYIDLSFNKNLELDSVEETYEVSLSNVNSAQVDVKSLSATQPLEMKIITSNVQILNIAGVDLGRQTDHFSKFLDKLFDHYTNLKMLNVSSSKIKNLWTNKWPISLELIDLSRNQLTEFDCRQLMPKFYSQLRLIDLSGNNMRNFRLLMNNCAPFMAKTFKISQKFTSSSTYSLTFDLSQNNFESLDLLSTNLTSNNSNNQNNSLSCSYETNKINFKLHDNPLVCDCDAGNWWGAISQNQSFFNIRNEFCINVMHFNRLSCASMSIKSMINLNAKRWPKPIQLSSPNKNYLNNNKIISINPDWNVPTTLNTKSLWTVQRFQPIHSDLISPHLICPYKSSCSSDSCDCCGFKACDCNFNCPLMCRCAKDFTNSFDLINCTSANLTQVPLYLPASTTEVLLNNNNLRRVQPYQFFGRYRIMRLDLTNNQLGFVDENGFYGLVELRVLKLSGNSLQILLGYEFNGLVKLEQLYLDRNRIQFVSNSTFFHLSKLRYLNLGGNNLLHVIEPTQFFHSNSLVQLIVDIKYTEHSNIEHRISSLSFGGSENGNRKSSAIDGNKVRKVLPLVPSSDKINNSFVLGLIKSAMPVDMELTKMERLVNCVYEKLKAQILHELNSTEVNRNHPFMFMSIKDFERVYNEHLRYFRKVCENGLKDSMLSISSQLAENNSNDQLDEEDLTSALSVEMLPKTFNYLSDQAESKNNGYDWEPMQAENEDEEREKRKEKSNSRFYMILNSKVFVWAIMVLIIIIAIFSFLVAILVSKLKRLRENINNKNSGGSNSAKKNENLIKQRSGVLKNKKSGPIKSIKFKFRNLYNRLVENFNLKHKIRENSEDINIVYIRGNHAYSHASNLYHHSRHHKSMKRTTSSSMGTSTSISTIHTTSISSTPSLSISNSPNSTTTTNMLGIESNPVTTSTTSTSPEYDLFIVYNNLDTELVKNAIGPVFRSTPCDLSVAYLHDFDVNSLVTYEACCRLVQNSTFVIFIFSKNLFTNYEYELLMHVRKAKRLAIVIDNDVNEDLVQDLVEPNRILKCSLDCFSQWCGELTGSTTESECMIKARYRTLNNKSASPECHFLFDSFDEGFQMLNNNIIRTRTTSGSVNASEIGFRKSSPKKTFSKA